MRILHLGKYYPPYRGGVETVMEALCQGLAARGADVTALVANTTPATVDERVDGVRVVRVGRRFLLRSQPVCPGLGRWLRELAGDIVHVHLPNPLAAWTCLRARPQGKWLALYHSDVVRQRWLGALANRVARRFLGRAAAITVPTPKHIEHSDLLPEFRDRCRVIHFGIDPEPFREAPAQWDQDLPEAWRERPLFLFVGRLVYYKGVEVLLRALALAPEAVLAVVGTGPLAARLQRLAGETGVDARVRFLGEVPPERIRSLYQTAQVCVLPSVARSEMFGLVQLEAFAASTPVISTDLLSGVPYVNQHGVTGIVVPPGDAAALAGAMRELMSEPDRRREMGRAALARVTREFHVEQMVESYLALYEQLLEPRF